MKTLKIFTLFLLISSFNKIQNYQFKINDFVLMTTFDTNKFESVILEKGFEYSKTENYKGFDVVYYKKSNKIISKAFSEENTAKMNNVFYETNSKEEYLNLKKQVENLGYKYEASKKHQNDKTSIYHIYKKNNIEIQFYTTQKDKYLGYCIGFENKN